MQSHVNCRTHRECHLDAEIASFEAALCYEVKQEGQTGYNMLQWQLLFYKPHWLSQFSRVIYTCSSKMDMLLPWGKSLATGSSPR